MVKIAGGNANASTRAAEPEASRAQLQTDRQTARKRDRAPDAALAGLPESKRARLSGPARRGRAASLPARMPDQPVRSLSALVGEANARKLEEKFGSLQPVAAPPASERPGASDAARRDRAPSLSPDRLAEEPPSLPSLIGETRAAELDEQFSSLQPVRTKGGDGIHAWERESDGKPSVHPNRLALPDAKGAFPDMNSAQVRAAIDLDKLKSGEKSYIWAVGALGRVFVGEEIPVGEDPVSGKPRYAGHPLLVAGGAARICGEIHYDKDTHSLVLLDKSGRYSRYADRDATHLANVAAIIARAFDGSGLSVTTRQVTGKAPEPLVRPTLARR